MDIVKSTKIMVVLAAVILTACSSSSKIDKGKEEKVKVKEKHPLDIPHNKEVTSNGQSLQQLYKRAMDDSPHYVSDSIVTLAHLDRNGEPYLLMIIRDGPFYSADSALYFLKSKNPKLLQEWFEYIKPGLQRLIQSKSENIKSLDEIRNIKISKNKK